MRVVHSLLHPDDLAGLVEREYDIPGPVRARLLHRGFNDTYVVTDVTGERWALRVYTRDKYWIRSTSDVRFELELLEHLAAAGRWVTRPYPRRGGGFLGAVPAPEGERAYAVFGFAPGPSVSDQPIAVERWHALGSEIARMHRCMDEFRSEHDRYHLDLGILLDMPLAAIEPYIGEPGKPRYAELCELADRLRAYVSALELPPDAYGLIHADLHDGNVNVGPNGELMCFDFDHCGYGWRGYDLATLFRGPDSSETERAQWSALLAGYETIRPLHPDERAALPVFTACRALWNIGDWLRTVDRNGQIWANDRLCERMLTEAREPLAGFDW